MARIAHLHDAEIAGARAGGSQMKDRSASGWRVGRRSVIAERWPSAFLSWLVLSAAFDRACGSRE
ncbi:hypothetical protein ASAP_0467 [Asaia bogorensis]|uniref:Uncharacterized protein n=1 Tax=Asaia bogorensis TaxID=91915 RepID=A0A060QIB0_9PROT|nr:hypothetical protein ASAP_0467 [Asaia bogorensis]